MRVYDRYTSWLHGREFRKFPYFLQQTKTKDHQKPKIYISLLDFNTINGFMKLFGRLSLLK